MRTKYIDIQYHYVREQTEAERIELSYLSTKEMVADGLTKIFGPFKFNKFIKLLGFTTAESDEQGQKVTPNI